VNASGNNIALIYNEKNYSFQSLKIVCANHIETTQLVGGGRYSVKSSAVSETITLSGRIPFSEKHSYLLLIKKLAAGKNDTLSIAGIGFDGLTLLSGKLTSDETEPYMHCELILTEVSE
jgi:hypothetical protein